MAEPILWGNLAKRSFDRVVGGRRVVEKVPQTATVGDYDDPRPAPRRWREVVDSYGNRSRVPITTAAADVDVDGSYARRQRMKWRKFGWYEIGQCPCALLLNDLLWPEHFVDQSVVIATPCQPGTYGEGRPCPHALAEWQARQAQNTADNNERMKNFQSESDKLIAANAKNSKEMTMEIASVVASAVAAARDSAKDKSGK